MVFSEAFQMALKWMTHFIIRAILRNFHFLHLWEYQVKIESVDHIHLIILNV